MVENPIVGVGILVLTWFVRNLVLSFEMHPLWDSGPRIESRTGKCFLLFSGIFRNFNQMSFERNCNALWGFRASWIWFCMFRDEIIASKVAQIVVQQEVHLCAHACTYYYVRQVLEFLDLRCCSAFSSSTLTVVGFNYYAAVVRNVYALIVQYWCILWAQKQGKLERKHICIERLQLVLNVRACMHA